MNRQKQALLSLFGLLVLALGYAYWMMPVQQRQSAQLNQAQHAVTAREKSSRTGGDTLQLELLEKKPARYSRARRDIFNFVVSSKKPVAPKAKTTVVKPPVKPRPVTVVTPVVRRQLARFTLYGFLIKDGVLTVFLSRGEELFLVREGDQFGDDGQFTALSITREKMLINQAKDKRTIEIQLVEKEPLVPIMQQPDVSPVKMPQPSVPNNWQKEKVPALKR